MQCRLALNFLVLFYLLTSFKTNAQISESVKSILGDYTSYKWFDLPVTEVLEPNSLIGGKMSIKSDSFILFSDTVPKIVEYKFCKRNQIDFFRVFKHFDYRKMNIKSDSIIVMTIICPEYSQSPQIDIIITREFLATEYKGYFYLFKKVSTRPRQGGY